MCVVYVKGMTLFLGYFTC